ncbi:ankyrin repeat protein [Achlya hypogyna]|uniref:Ankyrin repeat protein n=1 Tax=Achlya hypogyna TaxID=1202772 RepID=A0A1V9Y9V9_ACHHY|nr:ankyrin repeat protein [Achlya hypogyna]
MHIVSTDAVSCNAGQCHRGTQRCWSFRDQPLCNVLDLQNAGEWNICQASMQERLQDVVRVSRSPLHLATMQGRTESIEWLLEEGADINAQLQDGSSPLHAAALTPEGEEITTFLLANAADYRIVNSSGATPLHWFASYGRLHGMALLLAEGAAVNEPTLAQDTPLHLAALGNHAEVAQLLLGFGADADRRNARGHTPFEVGLFFMAAPPQHMQT